MPGKPFVMVWTAADTEPALKARYLAEPHPRRRQWLHGLWLLRRGWEVEAVADAVGAGRRTVERWIDWYRHEGAVAGVLAHRQGGHGQVPRLTVAQQEQVGAEVATGRFRTAAEIGAWIAQTYGVTYRPGGVTSLLARLRCHPKVPRPLHEKADPDAQEAWKWGAWRTRSRPSASPSGK
jgi:transposase